MFKNLKHLKNQRGLTLIELLVVVVILGIIAAIAIPSVGGLIDNSKKDAHAANATQMINAAKLAVTGDNAARPAASGSTYLSLGWLVAQGYLEPVTDPDNGTYTPGSSTIVSDANHTHVPTEAGSYVRVLANASNSISYEVFTTNGVRGVRAAAADTGLEVADYVPEADVSRGAVLE